MAINNGRNLNVANEFVQAEVVAINYSLRLVAARRPEGIDVFELLDDWRVLDGELVKAHSAAGVGEQRVWDAKGAQHRVYMRACECSDDNAVAMLFDP